jgi:hypothetical protein
MSGHKSYADRAMNRIARMGAMDASANFDIVTKMALQEKNRKDKVSVYNGAENETVWNIAEHEICYTVTSSANPRNDVRMLVLTALNGMGSEESAHYPNDPEMIRLAVRNKIRLAGIANMYLSAERGMHERGVSIALAGLNTLWQGTGVGPNIRPGDEVVAEVPLVGANNAYMHGVGQRAEPGIPEAKYRLQARARDPVHPARMLSKHLIEATRDHGRWKKAMGLHYRSTDMWLTVVRRFSDSYTTGLVLGVGKMIEAGWLQPTGQLARLLTGDAVVPAAPAPRSEASRRQGIHVAAHLAEFLGLTRDNGLSGAVTVDDARDFKTMRAELGQIFFHDPKNLAYEYGFVAPTPGGDPATSLARHARSGVVKSNDAYGDLLTHQLNHVGRAAAAYYMALQEDQKLHLGKALTGANPNGSNRFHIALGIAHP